jgi:hypothetical protein
LHVITGNGGGSIGIVVGAARAERASSPSMALEGLDLFLVGVH